MNASSSATVRADAGAELGPSSRPTKTSVSAFARPASPRAEYWCWRRAGSIVVPFIDTAGVAADEVACDVLACYGRFFFEHGESAGEVGRKVREWTREPAPSPADGLARCWSTSASPAGAWGSMRRTVFEPGAPGRLAVTAGPGVPAPPRGRMVRAEKSPLGARAHRRAPIAVYAMLRPGVTERGRPGIRDRVLRGAPRHIMVAASAPRWRTSRHRTGR
jgi:hypothetical protein